ncbi:hypothetical protein [Streptomyces sp. MI02-7b]|uniref:hypothetical protein n=1 Tax=Streptomyces sp. MI02-7b TaxID=462941 RepID=UPI0029CA3B41|nr:hypothetical protein [Streptomyces sp. MI02-7b]
MRILRQHGLAEGLRRRGQIHSRLRATVDFVKEQDTATLLPLLLPGLDGPELRALVERCDFSHAALLVFPPGEAALEATLADCGLVADEPPRPSVVVRERLAVRHHRSSAELDVAVLGPAVACRDGARRVVEVFALTVPPGSDLGTVSRARAGAAARGACRLRGRGTGPVGAARPVRRLRTVRRRPRRRRLQPARTARCSPSPRPPSPRPSTGAWSCTCPATTATCSPPTSTSTAGGSRLPLDGSVLHVRRTAQEPASHGMPAAGPGRG